MSVQSESLPHDEGKVNYSAVEMEELRERAYAEGFFDAKNAEVAEENATIKRLRTQVNELRAKIKADKQNSSMQNAVSVAVNSAWQTSPLSSGGTIPLSSWMT